MKEAGQQHSADQNDSKELLSGVENQDDKGFSEGSLYSPSSNFSLWIKQIGEFWPSAFSQELWASSAVYDRCYATQFLPEKEN